MVKGEICAVLSELRKEKAITQNKLCYGICSDSELGRIESGQIVPDYFVLNFLLSRLGKSTDKFEFILNKVEYDMYCLRFQIGIKMGMGELHEAERLLEEYQRKKPAQKSLHQQYVKWVKAQILWKKSGEKLQIISLLKEAVEETLPEVKDKELWEYALSVEELQILLFKWRIQEKLGKQEKVKRKIEKAIEYVERHVSDCRERVRIYPCLLMEKCRILQRKCKYDEILALCEKAEEILKETGIIVGLLETLQMKHAALCEIDGNTDREKELARQICTLKSLCGKYGNSYDIDWSARIWTKEICVDFELLRRQRYVNKMTQEQVCEGVCTPENLSRIEKGKVCPNPRTFSMLTDRLGMNRRKIETILCTSNYRLLEEKSEVARNMSLLNFEEARKHLNQIYDKLVEQDLIQCQYLEEKRISLDWWEKKITSAKALCELRRILNSTLGDIAEKHLCDIPLTRTEVNILVQIAIILESEDRNEEAIQIYRLIVDNYKDSVVDICFHMSAGTIMGNLAFLLDKIGEQDEAAGTAEEHLWIQIQSGRGTDLVRSLILGGVICERKGMLREAEERYKDAVNMGILLGEEERIKKLKYYLRTK